MSDETNAVDSILLVDDNPTNLQVLFQTLNGQGCKLLIAKNGETALSIAQKAHPDLILLDIMMPDIDGFEVCQRLKSNPETQDIPVIFLSALDDTKDKVKGLQLGAVDYVAKPFQADEVIARVNTHLTIHRLKREVEYQKQQLEHELEVVSDLQRRLLPKTITCIDGLDLAVFYQTSRYAGGDYYDFAELPENKWGILVADAEGHSSPAAVMMAMTCALFHSCPEASPHPADMLKYLNQHLCKFAEPSFMTALYVVFDANRRTLRIARAGHPPPMLYRAADQTAREVTCKGVFPLGIDAFEDVPEAEIKLEPGDRLLMYTDGLTERFSLQGDLYGEERLLTLLERSRSENPQIILENIIEDLNSFAGGLAADDDQALLVGVVT